MTAERAFLAGRTPLALIRRGQLKPVLKLARSYYSQ